MIFEVKLTSKYTIFHQKLNFRQGHPRTSADRRAPFVPWRPWSAGGSIDLNLEYNNDPEISRNRLNLRPPPPFDQLNIEKDMPGHKRGELCNIKAKNIMSKIIKFVHKEWPGLAEWHDLHQNWDQCFIKCKFT